MSQKGQYSQAKRLKSDRRGKRSRQPGKPKSLTGNAQLSLFRKLPRTRPPSPSSPSLPSAPPLTVPSHPNGLRVELSEARRRQLRELSRRLGIRFSNQELLNIAFTHPSYCADSGFRSLPSNQRLEFLGDAVLGLIVSRYLYSQFPHMDEGQLSHIKAVAVSEPVLQAAARKLSLGDYLLLGRGEEQAGGRERPSTLADAFESLVGAIFLEKGLERTSKFVIERLKQSLNLIQRGRFVLDYKSRLQELTQERYRVAPVYHVIKETGPNHSKTFVVQVKVLNIVVAKGKGHSKKEAEQEAARIAHRLITKGKVRIPRRR